MKHIYENLKQPKDKQLICFWLPSTTTKTTWGNHKDCKKPQATFNTNRHNFSWIVHTLLSAPDRKQPSRYDQQQKTWLAITPTEVSPKNRIQTELIIANSKVPHTGIKTKTHRQKSWLLTAKYPTPKQQKEKNQRTLQETMKFQGKLHERGTSIHEPTQRTRNQKQNDSRPNKDLRNRAHRIQTSFSPQKRQPKHSRNLQHQPSKKVIHDRWRNDQIKPRFGSHHRSHHYYCHTYWQLFGRKKSDNTDKDAQQPSQKPTSLLVTTKMKKKSSITKTTPNQKQPNTAKSQELYGTTIQSPCHAELVTAHQ